MEEEGNCKEPEIFTILKRFGFTQNFKNGNDGRTSINILSILVGQSKAGYSSYSSAVSRGVFNRKFIWSFQVFPFASIRLYMLSTEIGGVCSEGER